MIEKMVITMSRTTALDELKTNQPFTWGETIKIHEIAEYAIVEYHPFIFEKGFGTDRIDYKTKNYHSYVNGKDTACSSESLDAALAYCIAYKHEGSNTRASYYFMRSIAKELSK